MKPPLAPWPSQLAEEELPVVANTKQGVEFNPRSDWWRFRTDGISVSCNFRSLPVTPKFLHGFKRAMLGVAETQSGSSIENRYWDVAALLRFSLPSHSLAIDTLTYEDLARFARSSSTAAARLAKSKAFLQQWASRHYQGLETSVATTFPSCKQLPPGVAVATHDPREGPLDDQEFETILEALNYALEKGDIELDRALEIRLTVLLGARPTQLALVKCCDVKKDKYERITIDLPLVKGRDQAMRDEFRTFPLESTTGAILWDYRNEVVAAFASLMPDSNYAPLFPHVMHFDGVEFEPGFAYHVSRKILAKRIWVTLKKLLSRFGASSVRLKGELIPVSAIRFLRSFAQRGADEGIDMYTLAHLMGHRSISNVKVYFEVTDRIRARFSRKIAEQMAPLAAVFGAQLRILTNLSEATRPIPASRIPDLRLDQHGHLKWLASCAASSSCSGLRPYTCLAGCPSFEPFLDADLEPILDRLIADRERGMEIDQRIATIRDRAIYGCAQIMLRQRELQA